MKTTYSVMQVGRGAVSHLVRQHYLHKWPGVVTMVLGLVEDFEVLGDGAIGVIVFAMPPRETAKRYGVTLAWELARLFIEDTTPKNTESWFIARAIQFVRKHRPDVQLLISYADPSAGHRGTIYRASNWIEDGVTDQGRKTARFDYLGEPVSTDTLFGMSTHAPHYSRRSHVPEGAAVSRVARVSKPRFIYWMDGSHEQKRKVSLSKQGATI